jgi:hypothetical protein
LVDDGGIDWRSEGSNDGDTTRTKPRFDREDDIEMPNSVKIVLIFCEQFVGVDSARSDAIDGRRHGRLKKN